MLYVTPVVSRRKVTFEQVWYVRTNVLSYGLTVQYNYNFCLIFRLITFEKCFLTLSLLNQIYS